MVCPALFCSVPGPLGDLSASGPSHSTANSKRIRCEHPCPGLCRQEAGVGQNRNEPEHPLLSLTLSTRAGSGILQLDGVVPGKSPQALPETCCCARLWLLPIAREGACWQLGYAGKALAFLGPLDLLSGTAEVEVHTSIEHHLSAAQSSLNHPERQGSRSPSSEKEGDAQGHIAESGS